MAAASSDQSHIIADPADIAAGPSEVATEVALALSSIPCPDSFKCPMTLEIMADPVATVDGHVYEREMIQQWFHRGNRLSPKTGMVLPALTLTAEVPLRRAIEEYTRLRPELIRTQLDVRSFQGIARMLEMDTLHKASQRVNNATQPTPGPGALLEAALHGESLRCLEILAHPGFTGINQKDSAGRTGLHHAARRGLGEVAFAILARAEFNHVWAEAEIDGVAWTAIDLAVANGHVSLAAAMNAYVNREKSDAIDSHPRPKRLRTSAGSQARSASSSAHEERISQPTPPPPPPRDADAIPQYSGAYSTSNGDIISISQRGKSLVAKSSKQRWPQAHGQVLSDCSIKMFGVTGQWSDIDKKFAWSDGTTWCRKPPKPPGPGWTKFVDAGYFWWYYEGPLGKWWCQDLDKDVEPYSDGE